MKQSQNLPALVMTLLLIYYICDMIRVEIILGENPELTYVPQIDFCLDYWTWAVHLSHTVVVAAMQHTSEHF